MKKILITRKLIKDSEDKASKTFEPIFNSNDELYSQSKVMFNDETSSLLKKQHHQRDDL